MLRPALHLSQLAPLLHRKDGTKGLNKRTLAHRRDGGYMGGIQAILLPFEPKIKGKQGTLIKRYLQDFIVSNNNGTYEPQDPCTLVPTYRKDADVEFIYYSDRYYYKLPEGSNFLKR